MTDRHIHCVYCQWTDPDNIKAYCVLKQKEIEFAFKPHCDKCVLRPELVLSYFLKHENFCNTWECADKKANEYIEKVGFNTYPNI